MHRCPLCGPLFHCLLSVWILIQVIEKELIFLTDTVSVLPQSDISSCYVLWLAATSALLCQKLVILRTRYPFHHQEAVCCLTSDQYTASLSELSLFCNRVFYSKWWWVVLIVIKLYIEDRIKRWVWLFLPWEKGIIHLITFHILICS